MAAAQADTSTPPSLDAMLGMDPAKMQSLGKEQTGMQEQKTKAEGAAAGELDKNLSRDRSRMERAYQQEGATEREAEHLHWDADREMQKYSHSPMENFGSFATMFSIAASLFTKTPMDNALNAA